MNVRFLGFVAATVLLGSTARASDEATVTVTPEGPGAVKVLVTASPGWHINLNYPFRVTGDGGPLPATYEVAEKTAAWHVGPVPPGPLSGVISYGVCNASSCVTSRVKWSTVVPAK